MAHPGSCGTLEYQDTRPGTTTRIYADLPSDQYARYGGNNIAVRVLPEAKAWSKASVFLLSKADAIEFAQAILALTEKE